MLYPSQVPWHRKRKVNKRSKSLLSDGSGTEVVIDTLIKDGETNDSIRIKGGKVIYIGHSGDETGVKHEDGSEHVYVYVSSDDKEKNKDSINDHNCQLRTRVRITGLK